MAETYRFGIIDYIVFLAMIVLSTSIGIYFGWLKREKKSVAIGGERRDFVPKDQPNFGSEVLSEYLLGSRQLKVFPVAMSLVASYISGVTILGTASEIYSYGTQYWLIVIPIILQGITVSLVYIPVFTVLKVGSSYEYLEMRFHSVVRSLASFMFVLDEVLFLPFVSYVPALALNQVTGLNLHFITAIIVVVCVFYTLIGGIKAVVHTDAWQTMVMFLSVVTVALFGIYYSGGISKVFQDASAGGRIIFFETSTSPYKRQTIWSVLIGGFFYWTSFNAVNQTMVQRYMSLPSLRKAWLSMAIFTTGAALFISLCCLVGVLIYQLYKDCDPLAAGMITHDDQLLPLYVVQRVGNIYGMAGLFIAGVFGAGLSSLSVVLNSTALVILEDIVRGCFRLNPGERASALLVKSSIVVLGAASFLLVYVLEQLSGILSVATSMTAIAASTTFGVFTLGMLVPWSNTSGALAGGICSALLTGWISFGSQVAVASGQLNSQKLDFSVAACAANVTLPERVWRDEADVFPLYRFSYHWINPIGVLTAIIVGTIVSLLTGPTDIKTIDPDLISPVIHRFLPKACFTARKNRNKTQQSDILH